MTRDAAFFYHVLKPGRYLGGEFGDTTNGDHPSARDIVWFYPDRYERAITDPAWRRSFFQLKSQKGIRVSRAVEYARDVWTALSESNRAVFTLDSLGDIRTAASVVFWAPDIFTAAHIPSIARRAGLEGNGPSIGVLCDGLWIPRFLVGHVDWIAPAPDGWLPADLVAFLSDGGALPLSAIPARNPAEFSAKMRAWHVPSLYPSAGSHTPRWVPRVEVEEDFVDVELAEVASDGPLIVRDMASVVLDALDGLKETGIDGVRLCGGGLDVPNSLVTILGELQRRYNMKRVRAHWPAISIDQFQHDWLAYRPHLLKPALRLRMESDIDSAQVIDAGNRALNQGWQGLASVLNFDSYESLLDVLPSVQDIMEGWSQSARGHADKRALRVEYCPADIDRWLDPPDGPDDDGVRRYTAEFRSLKDDIARNVAVGSFRIEDVMARNWLAAADTGLWERLAELDLSDSNDADGIAFDWFSWMRQESGLTAPPQSSYLAFDMPINPSVTSKSVSSVSESPIGTLDAPAENLFGRRKQRATPSQHRLAAPPLTRMRVRWAKEQPWRLYSHLDLVRAIERSIRKAGLAAAYSEGFHPRLRLSFGPPLAFGLLSDSEYFDLILDDDYKATDTERLARSFPKGLRLIEGRGMAAGMPALSDIVNEAIYTAIIPLDVEMAQQKLDEFHERSEVSWQRIGREDRRPVDPRKTLREVAVTETAQGTHWELSVLLGGEGNIRPTEWAMLLFGFTQQQLAEIVIQRTALNIRRGSSVRTPFEPV